MQCGRSCVHATASRARRHDEEKDRFGPRGKYVAEVPIELIYDEESWSPTMSLDDVRKLEAVRLALRAGDVAAAAKHGRVFELAPVAVK
jgi:hypothetical protein